MGTRTGSGRCHAAPGLPRELTTSRSLYKEQQMSLGLLSLRKTEPPSSVSSTMLCSCPHTPGVRAPVHGINFGQVPPQRPPGAHLDSSHWVDVVCDLKNKSDCKLRVSDGMTSPEVSSPPLPPCAAAPAPRGWPCRPPTALCPPRCRRAPRRRSL